MTFGALAHDYEDKSTNKWELGPLILFDIDSLCFE